MAKSKEKPECRRCRHIHEWPPRDGERVVIVPNGKSAPGWAYASAQPRAVVVRFGSSICEVTLDSDGTRREIATIHVKRWCGYKPPNPSKRPRAAFRQHKPLAEGPWEEPSLFEDSA